MPRPGGCGLGRRHNRTCNRGRLGGPLRNRLQHIARFGDVRQVKLGLEFVCRCPRSPAGSRFCVLLKVFLDPLGFVHFDGTGVRFLFSYTDLDESVEDRLALYLELPCQVVNSNLLHSALFPPYCPARLSLHSILTVKFCRPTTASVGPPLYFCSPGFSSSETFSFSPAGRSCVVTSASSARGASSIPSTTSAS